MVEALSERPLCGLPISLSFFDTLSVNDHAGQFMVQNCVVVHWLNKPFHKAELNRTLEARKEPSF
jgi:hypothetical protein